MTSPEDSLILINPSQAQIDYQNVQNGSVWRGALPQEAYERREKHLMTKGIAANGGLKSWALVEASKADEKAILAGCESLRKRALVSRNGKVEEVTAYGIASVFTPPANRGKKYASTMMSQLSASLHGLQEKPLFSVLYSDIGKQFYAREGWKPFPSSHISLPPEHAPGLLDSLYGVLQPLESGDLPALCETDEKLVRRKLEGHTGSTAVALIPDHKTIEWLQAREDFVANEIYKRTATVKGAMATVGGKRVWAIWLRMWYSEDLQKREGNTMHILRLVVENDEKESESYTGDQMAGISAILRLAQHEAAEWNVESVELWNPAERMVKAVQQIDSNAKVVHRDAESIASLQWYGARAEQDSLVWMENEKYGWC